MAYENTRDGLWVDANGKVSVRTLDENGVPVEIPAEEGPEFERKKKELKGIQVERQPGPAETENLKEQAEHEPKPFNPAMDHDGDKKIGAAKKALSAEDQAKIDAVEKKYANKTDEQLAADLEKQGVKVDGRWSRPRLIAESEKLNK